MRFMMLVLVGLAMLAGAWTAVARAVFAGGNGLIAFTATLNGNRDIAVLEPCGSVRTRSRWASGQWRPAQKAAGITPLRRVYDLRHTFATFALRAGISTFDLSRYMGASLTMIDRACGPTPRRRRETR
jgi:integrase